jgi:hypothetical protein
MPNKSISRDCCREAAKEIVKEAYEFDPGEGVAEIVQIISSIIAKHCHAEPAKEQSK